MRITAAAALLLAVLAAYSNHFSNGFHFDDAHTVVDNPHVRNLANLPRILTDPAAFSRLPTHQVYRPVVTASLALDYRIGGGLEAWAFHTSTFLVYCLLLLVLFLLYRRLTGDPVALFAAALFGLHPVSAETVNYIIQRADLYATLGVTAALWLFAAKPHLRRWGLYLIPFVFAALSKPTALIFPALLAAYCLILERRTLADTVKQSAPAIAATVAFGLLLSRMTGPGFTPGGGSRGVYWLTQTWVSFKYFLAFFWPAHLSADSDEKLLIGFPSQAAAGLLFVAAMAAAVFLLARHPAWRPVSLGLAWFVLTLIPTAIVPLGEVANDHRMFFPFAGLSLAVCCTAQWLIRRCPPGVRQLAPTAACLVLAVSAYATHSRNEVWKTEETLWRDVTLKSPANGRGWMNYGLTLMARNDSEGALECFRRAAPLTPNYPLLEINTAIVKSVLGRQEEAEGHFRRALQLDPNHLACHFFYARWLVDRKRYAEAAIKLERTLEISPTDLDALRLTMRVHFDQQNWSALRKLTASVLDLDPADTVARQYQTHLTALDGEIAKAQPEAASKQTPEQWLDLSLLYYRAGRFEDCAAAARRALQLRPGYAEALNNLAAAHNALRQWDEGIAAAEQAVRLDARNNLARNNLAWARAEKARTEAASH